jgi:hypothetical protein
LKYLLDQSLPTIPQHPWMSKLLGFDFQVEYHPDATNTVAEALSRRETEAASALMALSAPSFQLFDDLRVEHKADQALWAAVSSGDRGKGWCIVDDLITVRGQPFVAAASPLLLALLAHAHGAGHEGAEKTMHRFRSDFYTLSERDTVR